MSDVTIYHNPRCSKSRGAMALLEERGVRSEVVRYLDTPPTEAELRQIISKLGIRSGELLRKGEAAAKGLDVNDDDAVIAAMLAHPILIERPIIVKGDRAVVGRPPKRVLELL